MTINTELMERDLRDGVAYLQDFLDGYGEIDDRAWELGGTIKAYRSILKSLARGDWEE